jgi:PAS domain-containing protein
MTPESLNSRLAGLFSDLADLDRAVQDNPPEPQEAVNEYQRLIERLPIGVCRVALAPDGKFTLVNPAFRQMLGLESDEALSALTLLDLFPAEADLQAFISVLSANHYTITPPLQLRQRDGAPRLCVIHAACDADAQHADCAIEAVMERRQAEEQAGPANASAEPANAIGSQLIYDCDTQTGLMVWGGDVADVLGYTAAQMRGGLGQWSGRVHPDDRGRLLSVLDMAEGGLAGYEVTYRFRHSNDDYVTMIDRGFFIADESGQPARHVGLMRKVIPG